MTITWKQELNLLNDEQLGRIAYADEDSWESPYYGDEGNGNKCCVMGHMLDLTWETMYKLKEYREQLGQFISPLQLFYEEFIFSNTKEQRKEMLKERVTLIQNEAKRILEERKQRVEPEQEIVTI